MIRKGNGMNTDIQFTEDPQERKSIPLERILKFTTPNGDGYLSFIVLGNGTVNISPFLCDVSVTINTTNSPVIASVLNGRKDFEDDDLEYNPDGTLRETCSCGEAWADEPGHDNNQDDGGWDEYLHGKKET